MTFRSTILSFIGAGTMLVAGCGQSAKDSGLSKEQQAIADSLNPAIMPEFTLLCSEVTNVTGRDQVEQRQKLAAAATRRIHEQHPNVFFETYYDDCHSGHCNEGHVVANFMPATPGKNSFALKDHRYY